MPVNRSTDNPIEHPLDYESWEIAFAAYEHYPVDALMLGLNLMVLKAYLLIEPPKLAEAIEGIVRAVEVLFKHSEFHEVAYKMFLKVSGGKLTLEEEEILKSLGLKF